MLNKIMHKDDIFIPNLNGKLLKGADNVDSIYISPESGDTPTLDYYVATRRMPYGSYHLYLAGHDYRDDPYSLYLFDLMSYIQNGGGTK